MAPPPRTSQSTAPRPALRTPASFGPPPKRVNSSPIAPSQRDDAELLSVDGETLIDSEAETDDLTTDHGPNESPPPALPSRANTMPQSLPQLPPRKPDLPTNRPKPSVPPRLPPRQSSETVQKLEPERGLPDDKNDGNYESGYLNKGSMDRLGKAGISVPGFNIGKSLPLRPANASTPPADSTMPSQGTSLAQKQAALRTAVAFRKNPRSVSLAEAKSAVATANNFRERHGSQVAQGLKAANDLNSKYRVADKIGALPAQHSNTAESPVSSPSSDRPQDSRTVSLKKPPPLPPKRRDLSGEEVNEPPPVPLASKPR